MLGLLLVFVTVLHVGHVLRYRTVSPIDELQHLDYLVRAPRGDIPGSGDLFLQESARIQTCARIDEGFDAQVPPCVEDPSVVLDVRRFQESGFNTAFIHPPAYYLVDGVLARGLDGVMPGDQSLLTTGRLAAVVWSWAAVVFLWAALAEMGARRGARAAIVVIVVSAPAVLHATATVNPDGTAIALGAALLWAVLRWERGRLSAWVPVVLAVLTAGIKVTNLVAVGVVVAYLLLGQLREGSWFRTRSEGRVRRWPAPRLGLALALVVAIAGVSLVWLVAQRVLQVVPPSEIPMVSRFAIGSFPFAELTTSWQQTVSPLRGAYLAPFLRTTPMVVMAGVVDLALMAGAVGGTVLAAIGSRQRRLGVVALGLAVLLGPALVAFNAVVQGIYVVIPPRYGLALVPALAVAAVPVVQRRVGSGVASVVALLAGGAALAAVLAPAAV